MDIVLHIIAALIGIAMFLILMMSFSRTAIMNTRTYDPINSAVTRFVNAVVNRNPLHSKPTTRSHRFGAWYMPVYILLQMAVWFVFGTIAFAFLYWATDAVPSFGGSLISSGSALSTLGFSTPENTPGQVLAIFEGALGLIIMVFFLTFIPGYQSAIQARELRASLFFRRLGLIEAPKVVEVILWLDENTDAGYYDTFWLNWEQWYSEIRATHVLAPEVIYTPSVFPNQPWVGCAATMLDAATLYSTVVDTRAAAASRMCANEGADTINEVSESIGFDPTTDVQTLPEISQVQYAQVLNLLSAGGVQLVDDSAATWQEFVARRAKYGPALHYLARQTHAEEFLMQDALVDVTA